MSTAALWPALVLLLVLIGLALLIQWAKRSGILRLPSSMGVATVRAITHVGPGQRLLTVDVQDGSHRKTLLIGATSHSLTVLDQWPSPAAAAPRPTPEALAALHGPHDLRP